ncbi:hypothetical protein IWX90DRAFT_500392 [Phyllosticta citrichinensis]|uniref:Uncharacterized protein n=1 Tax=Phyllosticta citrichinensis TaxID=1130410 RepID=A0ABR1Y172_9PEZI
MRSVTTTLLTTLLLFFFSTTTSAYKYRKHPYTVTCEGNRRDVNRYELQKGARDSIRGDRKRHPLYYEARDFDKAGNCADLWDIGVNDLIIYYAFEEANNRIWYCNYEVDLTKVKDKHDYFNCYNNYDRHTYGADEPPSLDEDVDDGEVWSRRKRV